MTGSLIDESNPCFLLTQACSLQKIAGTFLHTANAFIDNEQKKTTQKKALLFPLIDVLLGEAKGIPYT